MSNSDRIAQARRTFIEARAHLARVLWRACPAGLSHHYVQHRDRKPPWCPACGYAEDGTLVKEIKPTQQAGEPTT